MPKKKKLPPLKVDSFITTLNKSELVAGTHRVNWVAHSTTTGVYFIKLVTSEFRQTKKCILLN